MSDKYLIYIEDSTSEYIEIDPKAVFLKLRDDVIRTTRKIGPNEQKCQIFVGLDVYRCIEQYIDSIKKNMSIRSMILDDVYTGDMCDFIIYNDPRCHSENYVIKHNGIKLLVNNITNDLPEEYQPLDMEKIEQVIRDCQAYGIGEYQGHDLLDVCELMYNRLMTLRVR